MDIQHIYHQAKEILLEQGEFLPTLFVEFKGLNELVIAPIIGFGREEQTTLDKQKILFSVGRKLGKEYLGMHVSVAAFACEAWLSTAKEGQSYKYDRPSDDPKRKEALIVSVLDASRPPELKQTLYRAEMLRDGRGQLVDLLASSKPLEVGYNRMLIAFLAGSLSAELSESEFARLVQQYTEL